MAKRQKFLQCKQVKIRAKMRLNTVHSLDKIDFGEGSNGEGNQVGQSGDGDGDTSMLHHLTGVLTG